MVLKEILHTEKAYVDDLKTIIEVFTGTYLPSMHPSTQHCCSDCTQVYKEELEARGIISAEQSKIIFANVEDLELLNRTQVLEKFQKRFSALEVAGMPISGVNLGDIFLNLVSKHHL